MKRFFRLMLALMIGTCLIFATVSCDENTNIGRDDEEDDEEEVELKDACWSEYEDVKFVKVLKSFGEYMEIDYDELDVSCEEGWDESELLDEDEDLSKKATACTYIIHAEDGSSTEDLYFFMELNKKGTLDVMGVLRDYDDGSDEWDEDYTEENDEDYAQELIEDLIDAYESSKNDKEGVAVEDDEPVGDYAEDEAIVVPDVEEEHSYDVSELAQAKAYGSFYYGMSMDEAVRVIDGEYEIEGNEIVICDWLDEYYDEDYSITGYVNCDYITLTFENDSLYDLFVSTESLSEGEAEGVFDKLVSYYGSDYTYYDEYGAYSWEVGSESVWATLDDEYGDYMWYISIDNYDYY